MTAIFMPPTGRSYAYPSSDTVAGKLETFSIGPAKLEHRREICDKSSSTFLNSGGNMIGNEAQTTVHVAQEGALRLAVLESAGLRWLDFGDGGVQSAIDPANSSRLVLPLNKAMLAGLLFQPTPHQVLLLGTGGGAIARYFAHFAPHCQGDAVEQSPIVANIARQYFDFPGPDSGWKLHIAKAQDYMASVEQHYDLIVLDIAEGQHSPRWIYQPEFLARCRQQLTDTGALVINLIPTNADELRRMLAPIRDAFPYCTACLSVPEQHNVLVFGFREMPETTDIESRIPSLTQQWNLPFSEFLQRMRLDNPVGSGLF